MTLSLRLIGTVVSTRKTPKDDQRDSESAQLLLDAAQFKPEAFAGLELFSHKVSTAFFLGNGQKEVGTSGKVQALGRNRCNQLNFGARQWTWTLYRKVTCLRVPAD